MLTYSSSHFCKFVSYISLQGASTLDNVDEWKWKLSMLLRNGSEQEVVSRERKDRRDYEQLSALAERMGLYRSLHLSNFLTYYLH